MKKRMLVVSQYFFPEQFRVNDLTKEWIDRGYEVKVLTGLPNYPEGKIYRGYSWWKKAKDAFGPIAIRRLPIIPRGKRAATLFLNYLSFVVSGLFWSIGTKTEADLVFIYEVSPITQALPGIWYAKRKKIPVLLYVMDLWPESFIAITGNGNRFILKCINAVVSYIYKNCTKILVSSDSFAPSIVEKSVPKEKISYWPQYAEDFYLPLEAGDAHASEIPRDGTLNLTFTGNIGVAQGLDVLVRTALILKKEAAPVRFNIIGDGRYLETLKRLCLDSAVLEYFNFLGKKPATHIPEYLACSDAALLCLSKSDLFAVTLPAKVQSYLACGKPLIASADGEVQKVIHEADAGYCANAGDPDDLARSITAFMRTPSERKAQMAANARAYYEKNFSKKKLLDSFDQLVSQYGGF